MTDPTPEEIAKVDAYRKRLKAEAAMDDAREHFDRKNPITHNGIDVDDSWDKHALIGLLHKLTDELARRPTYVPICPERDRWPQRGQHWWEVPPLVTWARGTLPDIDPGKWATWALRSGATPVE